MADKLTPIGVFTKWVVAPVAIGLVGYYVVGPRIGGSTSKKTGEASDMGPLNVDPPTTSTTTPKKKKVEEGPNVEVTVQKETQAATSPDPSDSMPKPIHHKHKKAPKPTDDGSSSQLTSPPDDQGGSAGASTAG